ncbi:MAG: hypothetical protein US44_C0008G0035 [Candidatus Moranbacteria bacterium GW2011_GWD1_37_17]|nr:MAG: hypothetical protein US44_C0008G0035 [Candidatus Moranbacteria bacterium GW2011_GWD1_37_17]
MSREQLYCVAQIIQEDNPSCLKKGVIYGKIQGTTFSAECSHAFMATRGRHLCLCCKSKKEGLCSLNGKQYVLNTSSACCSGVVSIIPT